MCQNMPLSAKAVALITQQHFSRNVGKAEQHLLRYLLYAGDFSLRATT
jgi:hypothetical protein